MRAGQLRHRIEVQALTRTRNATSGGFTEAWAEPGRQMWAHVRPLSAREFMEAQANQSDITHTVVIRYDTPLPSPKDRIRFRGRFLHIVSAITNMDERDRWLVMKCTERTN